MAAPTNYFVCTLGEASQTPNVGNFSNVNDLIHKQARSCSDSPAIGFYKVSSSSDESTFTPVVLSFGDVKHGIIVTAGRLRAKFNLSDGETVGLLCSSSPEFLFVWLALIWLGHPVLLIAPQCSSVAIANLCKGCDVKVLLTDDKLQDLGHKATHTELIGKEYRLTAHLVPFTADSDGLSVTNADIDQDIPAARVHSEDVAYLHHTSGTSSGMPKKIPQSHHGAIEVLPCLDGTNQATFTTTPLYHGGPADIFRAWTSDAMVWLFPSKEVPVTALNVLKCLQVSDELAQKGKVPHVKYFTSVPYILQMMAADPQGLEHLQMMDLVGVGGAALSEEVGNQLVDQGVNLVSRFGSAECGFLMSSHRKYDEDRAWQYLRHAKGVSHLKFEARDEGLSELVIQPDWPHMAKRNRDDGSFATADLFVPHTTVENAWRYHSRADAQLTLITGKKFDPAPLEDTIVASSVHLSDVLVFGNGKPYPGALLFRSLKASDMTDDELITSVAPTIEKINPESQSHARIPRNMLTPMSYDSQPLEKSSKGTILRNRADERYSDVIEAAYDKVLDTSQGDVPDSKVQSTLQDLVLRITGAAKDSQLNKDSDLFAHGVDSVACVQIRHALRRLLPKDAPQLPLTIVEDSRNIKNLTNTVLRLRRGEAVQQSADPRDDIPRLVDQYSNFTASESECDGSSVPTSVHDHGQTILLTGPTGSLGSQVLSSLLSLPATRIKKIYLLVRGASYSASEERILKALSSRSLPIPEDFNERVTILKCKLSEPSLGIAKEAYTDLVNSVDVIIHLAWSVNFLLNLHSFAPHFAATQNLINLSLRSSRLGRSGEPSKVVFCSSVAAVAEYNNESASAPEQAVEDPKAAGQTGYASSKLAAELILHRAATTVRAYSKYSNRMIIIRVGQLSADTRTGAWNKTEAYPLILGSAEVTGGKLPDLGSDEGLSWVPVDIAGRAFVEGALGANVFTLEEPMKPLSNGPLKVLHLLNPNTSTTFTDLLAKLRNLLSQDSSQSEHRPFTIVSAKEWLSALTDARSRSLSQPQSQETKDEQNAFYKLLPFWTQIYADRIPQISAPDRNHNDRTGKFKASFAVADSLQAMPSLQGFLSRYRDTAADYKSYEDQGPILDDKYLLRTWNWIWQNVA